MQRLCLLWLVENSQLCRCGNGPKDSLRLSLDNEAFHMSRACRPMVLIMKEREEECDSLMRGVTESCHVIQDFAGEN